MGPGNADAPLGYPLETILIDDLARLLQLQGEVGATFPVTVLVLAVGCRKPNDPLRPSQRLFRESTSTVIDRDLLLLPDVVAERADADIVCAASPGVRCAMAVGGPVAFTELQTRTATGSVGRPDS